MNERFDAVVVGGGPAGSSAAWALCRSGLRVVVVDKAGFPRDKVCAGWVTPAVFAARGIDPKAYAAAGNVLQPITAFRSGLLDGRPVEVRYDEPVSYGILRREFDHYLLRHSGAELRLGVAVRRIRCHGGRWRIEAGQETLEAPWLIGAGGHFCPVARHLGARPGRSEATVLAQEAELPLPPALVEACPVRGDTPELRFFPELDGYAWVFRKGDWLNIGLGRENGHHISAQLDRLVARWQAEGLLPEGLDLRPRGHAYLLYGHAPRRLFADGVLLVGDAAGLAYPQSGEGIRPAVESGLIAAEVILEAPENTTAARLAAYPMRLAQRFGEPGADTAPWLPPGLKRRLARWILETPLTNRRLVVERWFLHRQQPPLVPA